MVMEEVERRFHKGDRVRIRANIDPSFYQGLLTLYNEGTVAEVNTDKFDLPMIRIEWDKNHWSYNGAPDCWTFEDHFDKVESMTPEPSKQELIAAKFAELQALMNESDTPSDVPESPKAKKRDKDRESRAKAAHEALQRLGLIPADEEEDDEPSPAPDIPGVHSQDASDISSEDYRQAALHAATRLAESEAFVVVAISRQPHPEAELGMLVPFVMALSNDPTAELLAGSTIAALAATFHRDLAVQTITAINQQDDDDEE